MNKTLFLVFVFGLILASSVSGGEVSKKMLKKLALYQMFDSCWGKQNMKGFYKMMKKSVEKCQGLTPTFDLSLFEEDNSSYGPFSGQNSAPSGFNRNTNNVGNVDLSNPYEAWMAFLAFQKAQQNGRRYRREVKTPTYEEKQEFKMNVMDYKDQMAQNIGNLTCVMADLGALDANLNINLKHYTTDMWNQLIEQPDPAFKSKLIEHIEDCYSISNSIPQEILDKSPIYKKLGRHMIFYKCQYKAEINLCAKQEISRYYEEMYGPSSPQELMSYGLPGDKFDAAYMSKKVKMAEMTESEKFVYKFIFTGGKY